MLTVYRVEHKDGRGPYHQDFDDPHKGYIALERTPAPWEDGIPYFPAYYRFGFKSLDQLYDWFIEEERERLKRKGFLIRLFKVKSHLVIKGRKQLVFDRDASICIGELPIH